MGEMLVSSYIMKFIEPHWILLLISGLTFVGVHKGW